MGDQTKDIIYPTDIVLNKKVCGAVKWFNNKRGYGFITYNTPSNNETNIFVHYNYIKGGEEESVDKKYKFLYPNEYVEFEIIEVPNKKVKDYKYMATNVTGINGKKLTCQEIINKNKPLIYDEICSVLL